MGAKIACSVPGCKAGVTDDNQEAMSEETRRSLIARFSERQTKKRNSSVQKNAEHFESRHGEERKEGEQEAPVPHIDLSQTHEENDLPNTYKQGEESHHASDLEPEKCEIRPDKCDLDSEDFWDECYGLIAGKKDNSDKIVCETLVEETLPEGSVKSFEEDCYGLKVEKKDDSDETPCENVAKETLPEGSVEGSEEDFVELNEVPDEFIGHWKLIKENHTENFDEFLIANGIPWLMRKAAIAMMGNVCDHSLIKTKEGLKWHITNPKIPVKTMEFGKETEVVHAGIFPTTLKYSIRVIRENGNHKLLTTEFTRGNLIHRENYIRDDGIMIHKQELNGVVCTRRFERIHGSPL